MDELKTLTKLVESFKKLPSVGTKSAERMAFAILEMKDEEAQEMAAAIAEVKAKIHRCPICGLYTESEKCSVCADPDRNHEQMIVVSYQKDVYAFEKMGRYQGQYHVLGGALSAVNGVGVSDLSVDALLKRIEDGAFNEVILATNPTIEGETTALFIARLLARFPMKVTRLAYGLPMGGHLDYADALTLSKALDGRTRIKEEG